MSDPAVAVVAAAYDPALARVGSRVGTRRDAIGGDDPARRSETPA